MSNLATWWAKALRKLWAYCDLWHAHLTFQVTCRTEDLQRQGWLNAHHLFCCIPESCFCICWTNNPIVGPQKKVRRTGLQKFTCSEKPIEPQSNPRCKFKVKVINGTRYPPISYLLRKWWHPVWWFQLSPSCKSLPHLGKAPACPQEVWIHSDTFSPTSIKLMLDSRIGRIFRSPW